MADILTAEQRRKCMSSIRRKNTVPELLLRSALHKSGLRYRLHDKNLPGRPDIVFSKYHVVLFVHGCYWHSHGCYKSSIPKSQCDFWINKLNANRERDVRNVKYLQEKGWRVIIVWECVLKGKTSLPINMIVESVKIFLHSSVAFNEIPLTLTIVR
jgi:DNA mismatch endonuclease, patch repair protein